MLASSIRRDANLPVVRLNLSQATTWACVLVVCLAGGCGKRKARPADGSGAVVEAQDDDESHSPQEKKLIAAGKPFVEAIAANRLADAFAQLSSHARKRMGVHQFSVDEKPVPDSKTEYTDVSAEQFATLFQQVVKKFGNPNKVGNFYVSETDANLLAGKAKDNIERISVMIAIGSMPADIPISIRKGALRAQVQTLDPNRKRPAKGGDQDDDDGDGPYFNVKFVLVEEEGKLKVGYFEFLPPSMLD